jgi:hypothetical protein
MVWESGLGEEGNILGFESGVEFWGGDNETSEQRVKIVHTPSLFKNKINCSDY